MDRAERILVVDDEKVIRTVIADALEGKGYAVQTAANAEQALRQFEESFFDLALVDLKMPGALDGLQLLERVHARWPATTVIVLTGYATLDSAITALRHGAYDYLAKPATMAQIVESVARGLAKRRDEQRRDHLLTQLEDTLHELKREQNPAAPVSSAERFRQFDQLTIDRQKRIAVRDGEPLALTATEFDMLDHLARHADRVVSARELVKATQGYELMEPDARPLVRVHIQRLRQKLEQDPENPRYILNVRGKGYRFAG